jgi:signal transduction histidine kinase
MVESRIERPEIAVARLGKWRAPVLLAIWTALGFLAVWGIARVTSHESAMVLSTGNATVKPLGVRLHEWLVIALFNFHWAVGWILLSPYVLWIASRLHVERQTWWWRLPLLVLLGAGFVSACDMLSSRMGFGDDFLIVFAGRSVAENKAIDVGQSNHVTEKVIDRWGITNGLFRRFIRGTEPLRPPLKPRVGFQPPFSQQEIDEIEGLIAGSGMGSETNRFEFSQRINHQRRRATTFYAMDSAAYLALVGIAHAFYFHRRYRERERQAVVLSAHLTEARLRALRNQLQPHFLFNALNGIATLVRRDPPSAHEMLTSLSELLRLALNQSERQEVPLREELEFLDRYLEIQKMRFGDRLSVRKDIDPAVLDQSVPPLVLQPLVENAIRHGIEPSASCGFVRIGARQEDGCVVLTVEDNGAGLDFLSTGQDLHRPQGGLGLASVRERLDSLYGRRGELLLSKRPHGGTVAEVRLPLRLAKAGDSAEIT